MKVLTTAGLTKLIQLCKSAFVDKTDVVETQTVTLATVATSGSYNDLSNKPNIPTVNNATLTIQKNGTTVKTFTANASSNVTANITVPTNNNELTNGAGYITSSALNGYATETWVGQQGFLTSTALNGYATESWVGQQGYITGITSSDVTTALGYTPYDASNPNGYTSNTGTVTSVNNVSPVSGNVTLSIPTVNDSTITIQKNGTTVDSFTTNASSNKSINITVPTSAADVSALPASTKYGSDLSYSSNTLQLKDQDGNNLGSAVTISGGGSLPSQTGNSGKFLTTDGTNASWGVQKTFNILDYKWTDYELNDQNWLNANTFSWQDGTVYSNAYNHLDDDYTDGTTQTETVGSYTIDYKLAPDGHKIVPASEEATVLNIYNESGVAWYYILDRTNQRFKLPRENPAREELIQVIRAKGNNNALCMTNGTYDFSLYNSESAVTGIGTYAGSLNVGQTGTVTGGSNLAIGLTTNSTKSGIISDMTDSTSVYKGKKYLYFYVGQFSQTATEQTAGLNSELFNGKVDLNATNLSTQGKSLISGLGMTSDRYDDLTLLASGNSYTAPAAGYYTIDKTTNGAEYVKFENIANGLITQARATASRQSVSIFIPVKQGDEIKCTYSAAGTTNLFRFIYAKGEVNV